MLVIYGPTATGKTGLAIKLAKKFNGEIISADSRQVYKGLDIGSGKVSFDSKVEKHNKYWIVDGIKINGFDLVDPGQRFSAADFLEFVRTALIRILRIKKLPIVVGGTGFYIKALIEGIPSIGIPADQKLRASLEKLSTQNLYQKLENIDPKRAKTMNESDRVNPRRLIRAIEIAQNPPKKAITSYQLPIADCQLVGLTAPNNFLYKKTDKSFEERIKHGMTQEIESLLKNGVKPQWLQALGLEYRWLTEYCLGKITLDVAVDRAGGELHNFVRRQKTWFKQFNGIKLFDITQKSWQDKLEKTVQVCYTQNRDRQDGQSSR